MYVMRLYHDFGPFGCVCIACLLLSQRKRSRVAFFAMLQLAKLAYSAKYNKVVDAKKRQLDDKNMTKI